MNLHHPAVVAFPLAFYLAQIEASFSWSQTLLVYGPLGLWVAWFVRRDMLEREERRQERTDQERRHQENLAAQKSVENAFRTNTNSVILGMSALKHLDSAYGDILARVRADNVPNS